MVTPYDAFIFSLRLFNTKFVTHMPKFLEVNLVLGWDFQFLQIFQCDLTAKLAQFMSCVRVNEVGASECLCSKLRCVDC